MSLKVILTLEKVPQAATKDLHDRLHMYKCQNLHIETFKTSHKSKSLAHLSPSNSVFPLSKGARVIVALTLQTPIKYLISPPDENDPL